MADKSCFDCPSYVKAVDVASKWGKTPGVPMCATYGKVLAKPGNTPNIIAANIKVRQQIASTCPSYGNAMPAGAPRTMTVMLPDPTFRTTIDESARIMVTTCSMCTSYIPEQTVAGEIGYTAGMCAAKGRLLFPNKLTIEARHCDYRKPGPSRGTTDGMHFLPEYDVLFGDPSVSAVKEYREQAEEGFVEPWEHPFAEPPTPEESLRGILGWRRIDDPDPSSTRHVLMPVYDRKFFNDEDQALVPATGSDEHPELYVDHFGGVYGLIVAWLELDETPVFWGQPGVGKTELLRHIAWLMQLPFRRISITKSTEIDDIAGKVMFIENETVFQRGRLADAWTKPGIVCLDEPNVAGDPAVWHFIRPLTDNSKQLILDMSNGEVLDRTLDTFLGMAMNPAWDTRNIGALDIADADANRLFHTFIEMPPPELEREIIRARVALDGWEVSDTDLKRLMDTAESIRNLAADDVLPISWAIRPQIKVARALRWFQPVTAYRRAAGDALEPQTLQLLLDQVRAHFPTED